jgi:DNA-binding CsgD family transcriptional regulator
MADGDSHASNNKREPLAVEPPLTPREQEVLHWLAEGKRDSEIADILDVKSRTVEQHVRAILAKLSVENRTAAAAVVWRTRTLPGKGRQP